MKRYIYIGITLIGFLWSACSHFDDLNIDPDAANKSTPAMLAAEVLLDITQTSGNKYFVYDNILSKQLAWGDGVEPYQYNIFGRGSFSGYKTLVNCEKMLGFTNEKNADAYAGVAHFVKAYRLFYISLDMGDIPYEEALAGENGNVKPAYNTQKEVMQLVLADLEKAAGYFSVASDFEGDPLLGGSAAKWRKAVTAFQLKVLMHLSKKEADADLRVKERFARLVSSGPLMESNDDNLQLAYSEKEKEIYPFNHTKTKHYGYAMLSVTLTDVFKSTGDYRLFYYAEPAAAKISEGLAADDWDAYIGTDPSLPFEEVKKAFTEERYSGLNARYTHYVPGEPLVRLGYAEQNFILAEAVLRGWIAGDAAGYYRKGIRASLDFITSHTPDEETYHHGRRLTDEVKAAFLDSPAIRLGGDREENIAKVLTQRYVASFLQHPYDAYYDYRRTGYPVFPVNPSTNQNTVHDRIPVRWMYPQSEFDYNGEHVKEAVERQYGGVDEVNKPMWIIK